MITIITNKVRHATGAVCCGALLFLPLAAPERTLVQKCLERAESYMRSVQNGVANVVVEQYSPDWDRDPSRQGLYRKATFRFGYAFDARTGAARMDSEHLATVFVKGTLLEPSDEVSPQTSGGLLGPTVLQFYYGGSLSRINCETPGILSVDQKRNLPSHELHLVDPFWITRSFIKAAKRDPHPSSKTAFFSNLTVIGMDHIDGTTQTVVQKELLVELDPSRFKIVGPSRDTMYSHDVSKYWINNEKGCVQRIILCDQFLRRPQVEFSSNSYRVKDDAPPLLCVTEIDARYDGVRAFPAEAVFTYFARRVVNGNLRKESAGLLRYSFSDVRINIPGFTYRDFFLYPEEATKILLHDAGVELTPDEYFQVFSDLDLDRTKILKRNTFFNPDLVK